MSASRTMHVMMLLITLIATMAALHFGSVIFAPLALSLFIIAITWPLHQFLMKRLPRLLALILSVSLTLSVLLFLSSLITWGVSRVGRALATDIEKYQKLYAQLILWGESYGISLIDVLGSHFNSTWIIKAAQQVTGHLNTTLGFWLVVMIYVILGLLEVDDIREKVKRLPNKNVATTLLKGTEETAVKLRRYMIVRTIMSIATGVFVWLLATVSGLGLAVEWGVIAFGLNYIPVIGPFVATFFPTIFAITQFGDWQIVALIFVCLNIIQFVIGSYIEPRVAGNTLSISPFIVLFSVFFWTKIWGLFGAFIGVPITITILAFCSQHPSTSWLSELLSGKNKH